MVSTLMMKRLILSFGLASMLAACAAPSPQADVHSATVTYADNAMRKDYSYAGKGPKPAVHRARIVFIDATTGQTHSIMANGVWNKGDVLHYRRGADGSIVPLKQRG